MNRDPAALAFAIKRSCENKVCAATRSSSDFLSFTFRPHPHSHPPHHTTPHGTTRHSPWTLRQAAIVALDEREGEAGIRATLNLGHTFGHAVETGMGYGAWLHGEAVSLGMVMAADMSARLGWIEADVLDRTVALLQRAHLPVALPEGSGMTYAKFAETMSIDKKVSDGVLRLILLKGELGKCVFTAEYDPEKLRETIEAYCKAAA